jgi:hypothetical protein
MTLAAAPARRRASDRLNPILVKEVRQSLRGRFFKVLFWITLGVATFAGLMVVAMAASEDGVRSCGQEYFIVMFGCLSAAVHAFVPFSAFLSTGAEWDENTHDLLVLSNLTPRQIVAGKLCSALTQGLLYYSTFGPFLVFAFLLNGIDLLTVGVLLSCSLVTCLGLSMGGIALATLARARLGRGLTMAVFGSILVMTWFASMGTAFKVSNSPQVLRDAEGQVAVAAYVSIALLVGGLFGAIATARFAHFEENVSSSMRVLTTAIVLLAGAWGAWLHSEFGDEETAWGTQYGAGCLLLLLWLFFLTEPETLGRRATKHVHPQGSLALLSLPFLPGGGRGVLLLGLHYVLALACGLLALQTGVSHGGESEVVEMVSLFYGYAFVFLALPTGLASFRVRTATGRMRTRLVTLLLIPFTILLPALFGLFLGVQRWIELEHPLNPIWVMDNLESARHSDRVFVALVGLVIGVCLALAINAPRVRAALREILAASRLRRERARVV